jgi:hypothetical protein
MADEESVFTSKVLTIGLIIMLACSALGFVGGLVSDDGAVGARALIGLGLGFVISALVLGFYVVMRVSGQARDEHRQR